MNKPPRSPMPLDDLPADRLRDALALAKFLRHHPLKWFVVGSRSAQVAQDLERCGLLKLIPDREGPIDTLRIVRKPVRKSGSKERGGR